MPRAFADCAAFFSGCGIVHMGLGTESNRDLRDAAIAGRGLELQSRENNELLK